MDAIPAKLAIEFERPADFFDLANLLSVMDCLPLLPMALLKCISGTDVFSTIAAGAARRDGSWSMLSRENLLVCIPAWRSIFQEEYDRSRRWREINDPNCTAINTCRQQVALIVDSSMEDLMGLRTLFRPWRTEWEGRMCAGCVESWKARFDLTRRDSFQNLPCHFGLPGWDVLTNVSAVSMDNGTRYEF